MKLLEIRIDHFGPWRDLVMPLTGEFSLLYGPNEAGKSSIMRAVRGVLFGFRPEQKGSAATLVVEHDGQTRDITRSWRAGTRGDLEVSGVGQGSHAERWLADATGGVSEGLFETVFAVGLDDIQRLASLDDDAVAESIYGLSLGPEGERLMIAQGRLRDGADRLGESLPRLLRRRQGIDTQIAGLPDSWRRFDRLAEEAEEIRRELEEGTRRRSEIDAEMKQHRFMERVYEPWRKTQELRVQQQSLTYGEFPADGMTQLASVESELERVEADRRRLRGQDKKLKAQYAELTDEPALMEQSCRIRTLLEEEEPMRRHASHIDALKKDVREARSRRDALLSQLGPGWTADRLMSAERVASPLTSEAEAYRSAGRRYKRLAHRYKAASKAQTKRTNALRDVLRGLGHQDMTVAEARASLEGERGRLSELHILTQKEKLLEARRRLLTRQPGDLDLTSILPDLIYPVLWFFAIGGAVLCMAGFWRGITDAWFIGLLYAIAGLSFMGITWTLSHFGRGDNGWFDMQRETEAKLQEVRDQIERLDPSGPGRTIYRGVVTEAAPRLRDHLAPRIEDIDRRLQQLRDAEADELRAKERRAKLTTMRQTLRVERQKKDEARQGWLRALRANGLQETLKVSEALSGHRLHDDARLAEIEVRRAEAVHEAAAGAVGRFEERLEELAHRLGQPRPHTAAEAFAWLRQLDGQIREIESRKDQRLHVRKQRKATRREIADLDRRRRQITSQRTSLFAQAGATTREEFEARAAAQEQAARIAAQIEEANAGLMSLSRQHPELAIVEDDLMAFDAAQNQRALADLEAERDLLDESLPELRERLGRLDVEREELASDRSGSRLRFDRDQVDAELEEASLDHLASGMAAASMDHVRERVEQNCQPSTLRRASNNMARLTHGKYPRVFTRLGHRELLIADSDGETWPVEKLSTGTREQLFLSLKMAMAEEFAADGGELPLVLDDVLVNFDQRRTTAAVDTLLELSESGQQVLLFSCHKHVAEMLEERGLEPIYLPAREDAGVLVEAA